MDDKVLEQIAADALSFVDSAIHGCGGINDRLDNIECSLGYCFDRLGSINESLRSAWLSAYITSIMGDLHVVDILIRKIDVVLSLQATLKEIHEIDAEFDK